MSFELLILIEREVRLYLSLHDTLHIMTDSWANLRKLVPFCHFQTESRNDQMDGKHNLLSQWSKVGKYWEGCFARLSAILYYHQMKCARFCRIVNCIFLEWFIAKPMEALVSPMYKNTLQVTVKTRAYVQNG